MKDGGPAFPVIFEHESCTSEQEGMSLRDYMATAAMQGMFAADRDIWLCDEEFPARARRAYAMADAILAAREEQK